MLWLLILIMALWILIQLPFVQNWIADYAAGRLSKALHTVVKVKSVSFTLLNKVNLEGLYIEDQHNDTLLSAGYPYAGLQCTSFQDLLYSAV